MSTAPPTRGFGFLESWLAHKRAEIARRLIPCSLRSGVILDIGCGVPASFLQTTTFHRKIGVDIRGQRGVDPTTAIEHVVWDVRRTEPLPFDDDSIDVITLLAMIEHIPLAVMHHFFSNLHRILRPGGVIIITTPRFGTGILLRVMSFLRLVSPIEIDDHQQLLRPSILLSLLVRAGFSPKRMSKGFFEWRCNLWVTAYKYACGTKEK